MQQALEYAETLQLPFVFSSNGDGFVFHDRTGQRAARSSEPCRSTSSRPRRRCGRATASGRACRRRPSRSFCRTTTTTAADKSPRYYQATAVNAAIEAIAKGQNRLLLVMATGTGKTYTAFQIIWRLWKAGRKKRILYPRRPQRPRRPDDGERLPPVRLGDGEAEHRVKVIEREDGTEVELPIAIDKKRRIDTSYEIYLGALPGDHRARRIARSSSGSSRRTSST